MLSLKLCKCHSDYFPSSRHRIDNHVSKHGQQFQPRIYQPDMVANPARDQICLCSRLIKRYSRSNLDNMIHTHIYQGGPTWYEGNGGSTNEMRHFKRDFFQEVVNGDPPKLLWLLVPMENAWVRALRCSAYLLFPARLHYTPSSPPPLHTKLLPIMTRCWWNERTSAWGFVRTGWSENVLRRKLAENLPPEYF